MKFKKLVGDDLLKLVVCRLLRFCVGRFVKKKLIVNNFLEVGRLKIFSRLVGYKLTNFVFHNSIGARPFFPSPSPAPLLP